MAFRSFRIVLLAFAISLAALGVAAFTAWSRCGDDDCSVELALGVAAIAPAALLLALMLLLLGMKSASPLVARVLLAITVGVAVMPVAAFIVRDVWSLLITAALFAAATVLLLFGEEQPETDAETSLDEQTALIAGVARDRPHGVGGGAAPSAQAALATNGRWPQDDALSRSLVDLDRAERRLDASIARVRAQHVPRHDGEGPAPPAAIRRPSE